jgi:carboxypeptidase family protein
VKRLVFAIVGLLALPAWSFAAKDFATITGTVQDSAGRFVAGALVSVSVSGPAVDRMKFTDSRGSFSFENLLPGEYFVQVTMPRYAASGKERVQVEGGGNAIFKFTLMSVAEVLNRSTSRDARQRQTQEIVWTLRSARGEQSVLRYTDSIATPIFRTLAPDYSGYFQFYSKSDPGARTAPLTRGTRFSVTLGLPADAKLTVYGQYNESPLETKGASALYEFAPLEGHKTRIGLDMRQGVVLDDAFTAEELKEIQASYSDKFFLSETIALEQGAEFGHAEGRTSDNYFRPRGAISWVPNAKTVIHGAVSAQAPAQADDPVRAREYFEQVTLPPSFEHYLHTELGVSRFLDEATKVSMALFQDRANYRALFVTAPDGRQGLLILDAKNHPSQGLRLFINREFNGFETGFGYTAATAPGFSPYAIAIDDVRSQINQRRFHVVTARVKTDFELTNTELTAVYRWVSKYAAGAIDPYQQTSEYNDPSLSISITQNIPTFGVVPAKVQAIFDARNLFEQPFGSSRNQLALSPRFVRGGINIRF